LSKKEEVLAPIEPGKVRIYHCGPTVYKRQHIGNMRRFLFADLVRRALEFFGYGVKEITNITDVGHLTQDEIEAGQDKLEKEAAAQKVTPRKIADRETEAFMSDVAMLNIQPSHKYPRATEHIKEMQELIQVLLDKGLAYQTEVGVFFDVAKFAQYGQLSGNTTDSLASGTRLEVRAEKRSPGDFALWLTDNPKQVQQWDSPWGRGYPGWHIECSAMSMKYLGEEIDIHTGGEDNKFPHHENEIAQAEGATGKKFVRTWMHNAHLQMGGQKLAKREGEQITLDTLKERNYSPIAFRLLVWSSHYRQKIDFSWEALAQAQGSVQSIERLIQRLQEAAGKLKPGKKQVAENVIDQFSDALADDLNTPKALAVVYGYIKEVNRQLDKGGLDKKEVQKVWHTLLQLDKVLGVIEPVAEQLSEEEVPAKVSKLAKRREEAREAGNYEEADRLRAEIETEGYKLKDTTSGVRIEKK